jgi:AcrR family transcriptional regulator
MRVTADTKAATRMKILEASRRLFAEQGYEATTTRDVAAAAGIASGTLFNYFATKEAIVACLAAEAMAEALDDVRGRAEAAETLEEDLFAIVAAGLRKMKPLRRHLPALLETALNPLAAAADEASVTFRTSHLEAVAASTGKYGFGDLSPTAMQLYWTLYTGALIFWANDDSPRQEDTLALIDDSLDMFVGWLRGQQTCCDPPPTRKR